MADMVFLQGTYGSKVVFAGCPVCGRISRQTLNTGFTGNDHAELSGTQQCPVCGTRFEGCSNEEMPAWIGRFISYTEDPDGYNASARKIYLGANPGTGPAAEPTALDKKVDLWKGKLLDLTKRNRMLNYRETRRSTLRITEPGFSELFNRLAIDEATLTFRRPVDRDTDLRTFAILSLLETLSCPIPVHIGDVGTDGTILERQNTLKNLRAKAKLAKEEQGTNILYLSFGFLEWREKNNASSPWYKAPLLLMPVSLELPSLNAPYTLSRYDDEIEVNPTLDHFLHEQFGVDLPPFELKDASSAEQYMAAVEELADSHGWKLNREMSLGLLSFLKISMYHDLENNRARMQQNPIIRAMVGEESSLGEVPPEYAGFDFDKTSPEEWYQVVGADSSQQEAILLSRLGISFVMQGPPGTGKSQTITNIIAEAIAAGKKVLFVSEKAAALQVVLKRLAEVHLDDFCLALHSHKANKKEILDSIGRNLKLKHTRVRDGVLAELTELFHDREYLNAYADQLHEEIAPLNESLYSAFGKLSALEDAPEIVFVIDDPLAVSEQQFGAMVYAVNSYAKAIGQLDGGLSGNPWRGTVAASANQAFQREFTARTAGLGDDLNALADALAGCRELGLPADDTLEDAARMRTVLDAALQLPLLPKEWMDEAGRRLRLDTARLMERETRNYRRILPEVVNSFRESVFSVDLGKLNGMLQREIGLLKNVIPDRDEEELFRSAGQLAGTVSALRQELAAMRDSRDRAADALKIRVGDSLAEAEILGRVCDRLRDQPRIPKIWFDPVSFAQAELKLQQAEKHAAAYEQKRSGILKSWMPEVFRLDTEQMYIRFRTEYTGFFRFMRGDYRTDMRSVRAAARSGSAIVEDSDVIALLEAVKEMNAEKQWFTDNAAVLDRLFGSHEMETDWPAMTGRLRVIREIRSLFPRGSVPAVTIDAVCGAPDLPEFDEQQAADLRRRAASIGGDKTSVTMLLAALRAAEDACGGIEEMRRELSEHLFAPESISLALLHRAQEVQAVRRSIESKGSRHQALFGSRYAGADTDWAAIASDIEKADAFFRSGQFDRIPDRLRALTASSQVREQLETLYAKLNEHLNAAVPKADWFAGLFAEDLKGEDLRKLAERHSSCVGSFAGLDRWLDHLEAKAACDALGLEGFTAQVEAGASESITDAFKKNFYRQWCEAAAAAKPAVRAFRRRIQEERIERFSRLDDKQLTIAQARIREKVIDSFPDQTRLLTADDELRILKRELGKKRRIMPLRKLFGAIPNLLLTLKPCLMMSPLSVAYFLEAKSYEFDMVIFDEASQIFPQDAIGAIFRGRQVIIAGDSKQLPPTNFFAAGINSDDFDDEEFDDTTGDSILEETAGILPSRTLLWHYRSKHEHLIAFSNQEIYGGDLITFPSSRESEPDSGVEFYYVDEGVYENGRSCNIPEAQRCVELVREHIEKHPDRSLGIIAFSEKQQQTILNQIQRFRGQNPQYESFFAEGRDDEFFVKNLENVQGDERDTIIFSICYARTAEQKRAGRPMAMRFGPLGHAGGERRLNVAITRAKRNIKLVSSILPSDIDLSKTDAEGIRMLRSYIEFARNGAVALRRSAEEGSADEFAGVIADFLEKNGYKVRRQVGCSGYKLDIAVEHPDDPERFIAGIECDGLSYAAARTARDRDHLRRSVLESMGWNIYRVWSAEWLNNPEIEGGKLLEYLKDILENTVIEKPAPDAEPEETTDGLTEEVESAGKKELSDFSVYVEADWAHAADDSVEGRLMHIIAIEQPVHTEVLYGRMTGALGRKMVTPVVRRAVDTALARLRETGKIRSAREFWTLAGFSDIRVRTAAPGMQPRQIAHIPAEEIALAMLSVAESTYGLSEKGLLDETAAVLGYARRGERITARLHEIFEELVQEGRLRLVDDKIQT